MGAIFDPPSPPKPPPPPPPTPIADIMDPAVIAERQRMVNLAAARSGRAAQLLSTTGSDSTDKLGVV